MRTINHLLNENHQTMLLDLSLQEIVDAGKINNPYHVFVLSMLIKAMPQAFVLAFGSECEFVDNEVLRTEFVKNMPDSDAVKLAKACLDTFKIRDACPSPHIPMVDWMRYVIGHQ